MFSMLTLCKTVLSAHETIFVSNAAAKPGFHSHTSPQLHR